MTRLEDWVADHRVALSRIYMTAGVGFGLVSLAKPAWGMPGMAFSTAAIVLRRDDIVHAVRLDRNTDGRAAR